MKKIDYLKENVGSKIIKNYSTTNDAQRKDIYCVISDSDGADLKINRVCLNDIDTLKKLKAGDCVYLFGTVYTARDAAHKRLFNAINGNDKLPFELNGAAIYYVGPCIGKDGKITSAGPTTSCRMDTYAPEFYDKGMIATIGKGDRNEEVYKAIKRNNAVYFSAVGGAGALYANAVEKYENVCYEDLGTEAVRKLTLNDFPAVVAIDSNGDSIYN